MRDELRTIPGDQIRGDELREWHVVEVECWRCHHIRVLPHQRVKVGKRGEATLAELHFRCQWCGADGPHRVTVMRLPRNT